jgi:surface antigen
MTNNMKKWMITAMIMAVMFVGIIGTSSAATPPPYWGNKIGSFTYNGVEVGAYSNGANKLYSGPYGTYGYQFQCVEYVNRFYVQALGHKNMRGGGNAKNYYSTASSKELVAYRNGVSKTPPQMGDIICSNSGTYGHVAIVRQVLSDRIYVIHQNWEYLPGPASNNYYNQECNYKPLTLKRNSNGSYTVGPFSSSYSVYGWLHKP